MKLKASHWWTHEGVIVIEVRDHDAMQDTERVAYNPYSGNTNVYYNRKPQIAKKVVTLCLPKGTSTADVKLAKQNAIMLYEIKVNETST